MSEAKFEIGGHLIDARGQRHQIVSFEYETCWIKTTESHRSGKRVVFAADYLYEPPPRILSLQEAIEAAKAGETVEHSLLAGVWRWDGIGVNEGLKNEHNEFAHVHACALTGWTIRSKAKPLPAMTAELARALDNLEVAFKADSNGYGYISTEVFKAYREAKGGANCRRRNQSSAARGRGECEQSLS